MNIKPLGTDSDGTRNAEIRCNELSYRALLRFIRKTPGAVITDATHDPMNDHTHIGIMYKGVPLTIETPFSDYVLSCSSSSVVFDAFVTSLSKHQVKWWDRWF